MKVILKEDVEALGRKGDVVEVADGYARNFLFPRALAVFASRGNLRSLEQIRVTLEKQRAKEKEEAEKLAQELMKLKVSIPVKAGDKGKLFGSVTSQDIAGAIEKLSPSKLDRRKIESAEIKTLGTHRVKIHLYPEVEAQLEVEVIAETRKESKTKKEPKK